MKHINILWIFWGLIIFGIVLSGCSKQPEPNKIEPAIIEHIEGTEISKVILTERAAQRLGIKTENVRIISMSPPREVVPYAAVLYDEKGNTWVYTCPEPLVYVRHKITVDYIEGSQAVLMDGPSMDTKVVTVGAAELFGAEFEVGH